MLPLWQSMTTTYGDWLSSFQGAHRSVFLVRIAPSERTIEFFNRIGRHASFGRSTFAAGGSSGARCSRCSRPAGDHLQNLWPKPRRPQSPREFSHVRSKQHSIVIH